MKKTMKTKVKMLLAPLVTKTYPKHPKLSVWRPVETVVTVESVQWNWMEWRELLWPQSISHRWEQISCSELCGPLMLLAVGFEYVPHSCFRVSKTINMCTYDSCLLDHPSRDSYLMWTSHTQQVVSLAQTSPWCFVPLTVIAKDRQGAWTLKNPWEANTSSSCVFKQLWSFSATPSRGSGSQRT